MSTVQMKFCLYRPHASVILLYRLMRKTGLDRYSVNMMCIGAVTMFRELGDVELRRL